MKELTDDEICLVISIIKEYELKAEMNLLKESFLIEFKDGSIIYLDKTVQLLIDSEFLNKQQLITELGNRYFNLICGRILT